MTVCCAWIRQKKSAQYTSIRKKKIYFVLYFSRSLEVINWINAKQHTTILFLYTHSLSFVCFFLNSHDSVLSDVYLYFYLLFGTCPRAFCGLFSVWNLIENFVATRVERKIYWSKVEGKSSLQKTDACVSHNTIFFNATK